jgi:hypothetical protein
VANDGRPLFSRGDAVALAVFFWVLGGVCVLIALDVLVEPFKLPADTPPWIAVCVGLVFGLGGVAVIIRWTLAGRAERTVSAVDAGDVISRGDAIALAVFLWALGTPFILVSLGLVDAPFQLPTWLGVGIGLVCAVAGVGLVAWRLRAP